MIELAITRHRNVSVSRAEHLQVDSTAMTLIVCLAILGPFLLSLMLTIFVRAWAVRRGFVDHPTGHKRHDKPVALGGGVAIMLSIFAPIVFGMGLAWWFQRTSPPDWLPEIMRTHLDGIASKLTTIASITMGALVLHVVGIIDDRRAMGPWPKLFAQTAVAIFIAGPVGIRACEALPPIFSITLTVLWIVIITNAFNFLDNMDGLSAGVAVVALSIFSVAAVQTGQIFVPVMAWVTIGALLGFLVFNFSPASIYMGDSGSLVVGYLLSVLTILTTFYDPRQGLQPFGVFVPVVVLAVPLYDVISVVIHRIRAGDSPFRGDQRHFSHRLVKRGMSPRAAVLTIYLATAATGLPAIMLSKVTWRGAVMLLIECLSIVAMIAILEHTGGATDDDTNTTL